MQSPSHPWGEPVWSCPVPIVPRPLRQGMHVDVAVLGAGFTGLATAHYVLQHFPGWRVAVFESQHVGAGASGRTGGLVLEDTAIGPLPGVEGCIATLQELVHTQSIACDLRVGECWEIGRQHGQATSPIQWADHGTLRVVKVIPGGAFDPKKFLAGLAERVQRAGGEIFERAPVTALDMHTSGAVRLTIADTTIEASRVVFATNAFCLELLGLRQWTEGVHTIAVATEALPDTVFETIGWATHTPFYTLDTPYLWGRVTSAGRMVIGGGVTGRGQVDSARVDAPEAIPLFTRLEQRIRGLHPALQHLRIPYRWMGPLCRTADSKPIVSRLDAHGRVLLATGYGGHGVALSVRVGKLLAEVLAGDNSLPTWSYQPLVN